MPYSDNLYSLTDDGSDVESIDVLEHASFEQSQHEAHQFQGRVDRVDHPPGVPHTGPGSSDNADDNDDFFSPTDGYFHAATSSPSSSQPSSTGPALHTSPNSSHVPYVPNVWVRDPSLAEGSTADSKAREAYEERLSNNSSTSNRVDDSPRPQRTSPAATAAYDISAHHGQRRVSHSHNASTSSTRSTRYPPPARSAYTPSTTASYTSHTPRRPSAYDERQPFFPPREAPPAYTPSNSNSTSPTSPTTSHAQTNLSSNYSTFAPPNNNMGHDESRGLLARDPESMGNPEDEYVGTEPAWREGARRRMSCFNWRSCRMLALAAILLFVTAGFLVSMITSARDQVAKDPAKRPTLDKPNMDYPAFDGDFSWPTDQVCKDLTKKMSPYSFDLAFGAGRAFSFVQDIAKGEPTDRKDVKVFGDVLLRRTGDGTPGPSVVVEITSNDDDVNVDVQYSSDTQSLIVTVPRGLPWDDVNTWPCVRIMVTIWTPSDGSLEALSVENVHLGIKLLDNLSLRVVGQTMLSTVVGPIVASVDPDGNTAPLDEASPATFVFDSRHIEVKSISANIKGHWPLYDLLGIHSTSGTITAGIEPQKVNKDHPKPAILRIRSVSGDVHFNEPIYGAGAAFLRLQHMKQDGRAVDLVATAEDLLPPRDYHVDISTTSGNIEGSLAFSSMCHIHTISGTTKVELLPALDKSLAEHSDVDSQKEYAALDTESMSGNMQLHILDALWIDAAQDRYISAPSVPSTPSTPSTPSAPSAPSERDERRGPVHDIGKIGRDDPYNLFPPATGRPSTAVVNLSASNAVRTMMRCLRSKHTSTSATLKLHYPTGWEGDLELSTIAGKLKVWGDKVDIIRSGKDWPGINRSILARKGAKGGSKVTVSTTSGNVEAQVGEKGD